MTKDPIGDPNVLEKTNLAKRVKHIIDNKMQFGGGKEEYDMIYLIVVIMMMVL